MSLVHVVVLHGGLHVHKEKLTTSIVCVSTESAGFKLFKQLVHVTFVLVALFLIAQLRSAWARFFDLFCQHGFWKGLTLKDMGAVHIVFFLFAVL